MKFMTKLFSNKVFESKIDTVNTQKKEMWLGYFFGPCLVYMAYYAIAGTYLTQFYTDVLGMSGVILTFMPVISKIIDAITNIIMGRIIDKTHTSEGKARPWVLLSGVCMAVTGVLLYTVPGWSNEVQIVWVVVSYNLFFAFAFTIYNISHALLVPLSTRNTKQRDGLAMMTSMGTSMLPGLLVTIILPIMINAIGVGSEAQSRWMLVMGILSMVAIPATLVEYYFTKERVTEESEQKGIEAQETISFMEQLKACFSDKYWVMIISFFGIYQLLNFLSTNSMLYYCNWVLGNSVESGTGMQILVNAIGQAPLGFGIFILWPLVRKFGKRWVTQIGFVIAAIGSAMVLFLGGNNFGIVLGGLFIKSIGALPTYAMMAQIAEALDHIEWKRGFRADGFSSSVTSIMITVAGGIGQTIILGGINAFGYIAPASNVEVITQPQAMQTFFAWCFVGIPMVGYLIGSLIMTFYDVEGMIPQISADIVARHKAEAEARGEVYISPEEKERMEQEKIEREMEIKRVEELKTKCAKKGLSFEVEEAKYQEKLAQKKAKAEAKKKK